MSMGLGDGLSFEQAPPVSIPLRFFLLLAGATMIATANTRFLSRWSPATPAATHLIIDGCMLQVMLGALFQLVITSYSIHYTKLYELDAGMDRRGLPDWPDRLCGQLLRQRGGKVRGRVSHPRHGSFRGGLRPAVFLLFAHFAQIKESGFLRRQDAPIV